MPEGFQSRAAAMAATRATATPPSSTTREVHELRAAGRALLAVVGRWLAGGALTIWDGRSQKASSGASSKPSSRAELGCSVRNSSSVCSATAHGLSASNERGQRQFKLALRTD